VAGLYVPLSDCDLRANPYGEGRAARRGINDILLPYTTAQPINCATVCVQLASSSAGFKLGGGGVDGPLEPAPFCAL
jgi:hypothetical protein